MHEIASKNHDQAKMNEAHQLFQEAMKTSQEAEALANNLNVAQPKTSSDVEPLPGD